MLLPPYKDRAILSFPSITKEFLGLGKPPFEAFCQFPEQTLIVGQEVSIDVVHCDTDFCFEHPLKYNVPEEQFYKLLEVSSTCSQLITLQCFLSPIKVRNFYYSKSVHFIINTFSFLPENFCRPERFNHTAGKHEKGLIEKLTGYNSGL